MSYQLNVTAERGLIKAADWAAERRAAARLIEAGHEAERLVVQAREQCEVLYAEARQAAYDDAMHALAVEQVALNAMRAGLWNGLEQTICQQVVELLRGLCQGVGHDAIWLSAMNQLKTEFPKTQEVTLAVHPDALAKAKASCVTLAADALPFLIHWNTDSALSPLQCRCTWQQRTVIVDFDAAIARIAQELKN